MAEKQPDTYKITVPGGLEISLFTGIKGDSGLKHDKFDPVDDQKSKETITAKPGHPYVETGVSEARMEKFKPYVKQGVKIEKEAPPKKEKKAPAKKKEAPKKPEKPKDEK